MIAFLMIFSNAKAQFSGSGSGTEADPYKITSSVQLNELRNFLGTANSGQHFQLMNDIDLSGFIAVNYPSVGWLPIGDRSSLDNNAFYGSLQGNGFTIKNLWIARSGSNYIGLFGNLKNATIDNLNIQLSNNGIIGGLYVGALSGLVAGGSVKNTKMTGTINSTGNVGGLIGSASSNALIQNNSTNAIVNSTKSNSGGLIGNSSTAVTNCHSSGEVNVAGDNSGGLIGLSSAAVSGSSSTSNVKNVGSAFVGNFMGGLVGTSQSTVTNSNATVTQTVSLFGVVPEGGYLDFGGFAGDSFSSSPIQNCFATGEVTVGDTAMYVGGLVGLADTAMLTELFLGDILLLEDFLERLQIHRQ